MKVKRENKRGFTLIEVVVVMAIIAVLAVLVTGAIGVARTQSRNTQRTSDLRNLQTGLEAYYARYGGYPTSASSKDDGSVITSYSVYDSIALQPKFLEFLPKSYQDPKYPGIWCYNAGYVYVSNSFRSSTLATKYVLYATFEGGQSTNLNPTTSSLDYWATVTWPTSAGAQCSGYGTINYRVGEYR